MARAEGADTGPTAALSVAASPARVPTSWPRLIDRPLRRLLRHAGSVFVSQRPCRASTCRRLLQQASLQDAIADASDGQKITVDSGARWCAGQLAA